MSRFLGGSSFRLQLLLLLSASYALRLIIVVRGGQFFWPDEQRYQVSRDIVAKALQDNWLAGLRALVGSTDHVLFKAIGIVPALLEQGFGLSDVIPAAFFAGWSVLMIALIWSVARRAGAGPMEAFTAASLAAVANCLFYYSRHLFPYDLSLALILAGAYWGLGRGVFPMMLAGVCVGLGFLSYNGYWQIGGAVMSVATLAGCERWSERIGRTFAGIAGLTLPLLMLIGLGRALDVDVIAELVRFSKTANVGNLGFGWSFVGEYLWQAERGISLAFGCAVVLGVIAWIRGKAESRLRCWIAIVALSYAAIVFYSDIARTIVVHARTVRCLVPFLCLITAAVLIRLRLLEHKRWLFPVTISLLVLQGVVNLAEPLTQVFPDRFLHEAQTHLARLPQTERGNVRIQHAHYLHYPDQVAALPANLAEVVLARKNPIQFAPYLYEGFIKDHRDAFMRRDAAMRIIRVHPEPIAGTQLTLADLGRWEGYPGALKFTLRLPEELPPRPEPIIVTGVPTRGDFCYIVYSNPGQICIGFDSWSRGGPMVGPFPIDPQHPIELIVSSGALYPPPARLAAYGLDPRLKDYLVVEMVSRPKMRLLARPQPTWPSDAGGVSIARNGIGGTTTSLAFTGKILAIEPITPEEIVQKLEAGEEVVQ